ncbi:hypothetical protein IWQ61_005868, partial [Dispira simplex]
ILDQASRQRALQRHLQGLQTDHYDPERDTDTVCQEAHGILAPTAPAMRQQWVTRLGSKRQFRRETRKWVLGRKNLATLIEEVRNQSETEFETTSEIL